ncbi:hypothetical protein QW131_01800 [Roseibium salinum]|nr:hypothetical protein [Roseibium salinum]
MAGFELLENDHELIHHRIETVIGSANKLLGRLREGNRDKISPRVRRLCGNQQHAGHRPDAAPGRRGRPDRTADPRPRRTRPWSVLI